MKELSTSEMSKGARARIESLDDLVISFLRRASLPLLRVSLGVIFIWFGALKVANATPVAQLVADTLYWIDSSLLVPLLGIFEVLVGIALLSGRFLKLALMLLVGHMLGTFLVLVVQPQIAFRESNPLLLTTEGEFVVKNLVLLSGALVIGSQLQRIRNRPIDKAEDLSSSAATQHDVSRLPVGPGEPGLLQHGATSDRLALCELQHPGSTSLGEATVEAEEIWMRADVTVPETTSQPRPPASAHTRRKGADAVT